MPDSDRLDHLIRCARHGAHAGSSENEKNVRRIVEALLDGTIGLDEDAVAGIGELAKRLYEKRFEARDAFRAAIGPNPDDVHYLELRDEASGLRYYLEGKPLHAGDLISVFTEHGWQEGRYEWNNREDSTPSVWFDDEDGMVIEAETPCRQPQI